MAAATVASLSVEITGDVSGLNRAMDTANRKVNGFSGDTDKELKKTNEGWKVLATTMFGVGVAGVNVAADFQSSMNEISARTGLVGADLDRVREFALQMGADSAFSAQQASDAFLQLLTSGSSVEESMATLPHVLNLAAASGMDLGYTADILTDTLAQFGLEVGDSAMVADVFAKAAGASSAEANDIAMALGNVGPVAAMFGLSVDEAAAAIAVLSENGIKGAEAGTSLKSVLLNLARPTDKVKGAMKKLGVSLYDANGDVRDFDSIIDDLGAALDELPMDEQIELSNIIAGSYGIVGLNALRASGGIDAMLAAMQESAGASEVAEARLGGFHGAVERLGGALETLAINTLTPLMENVLTPAVNITVETIDTWTNDIPAQAAELGGHIGEMILAGMEAEEPVATFIGNLINDIGMALNGTNIEPEVEIKPIALIPTDAGQQMVNDYNAEIMRLIEEDGLPVSFAVQRMMEVQQGFTVLPQPVVDENWDTPQTAEELAAMMSLSNPVSIATGADIVPVNATDPAGFNLQIGGFMDEIVNGEVFGIDPALAATATLTNGPDVAAGIRGDLQAQNYNTSVNAVVTVNPIIQWAYDFAEKNGLQPPSEDPNIDPFTGKPIPPPDLSIPPGMNYNGTPDGDGDPLTPMRTGGKVPYDNFAALLHKGEIVVPANYADRMGGGPTIIINAGNFLAGRQEVVEWVLEGMAEAGYG